MHQLKSRMKKVEKRQIAGWIAVGLSILITCAWAFWGIIENFHEGWYFESLLSNLGLMFVQYLSPMLIFMGVALISIYFPRFGGGLHVVSALLAIWFFGAFTNAVALAGGYGDGAIITNVEELLLWDCNFYNNKLNDPQPDLIEQLHETGKLNNGKSTTYAYGLLVDKYKGQNLVSHSGSWAGYHTEMMRLPDQRFTVICISNLSSIDPTILCHQVADISIFKKPSSPKKCKKKKA